MNGTGRCPVFPPFYKFLTDEVGDTAPTAEKAGGCTWLAVWLVFFFIHAGIVRRIPNAHMFPHDDIRASWHRCCLLTRLKKKEDLKDVCEIRQTIFTAAFLSIIRTFIIKKAKKKKNSNTDSLYGDLERNPQALYLNVGYSFLNAAFLLVGTSPDFTIARVNARPRSRISYSVQVGHPIVSAAPVACLTFLNPIWVVCCRALVQAGLNTDSREGIRLSIACFAQTSTTSDGPTWHICSLILGCVPYFKVLCL